MACAPPPVQGLRLWLLSVFLGPPGVLSATPVFVAAQENLSVPRICAKKGVWWRQDLIKGLSVSSHSVGEVRPTVAAHHGHMGAHSRAGVGALLKLMRRDCM